MKTYQDVLNFWFKEGQEAKWFEKSKAFDEEIRKVFLDTWKAVRAGESYKWRKTLEGAVAEIIVLDQFSRNLFRSSPLSFSQDGQALVLAQTLVERPGFENLSPNKRRFALMPFMHSESKAIHALAYPLFQAYTDETTLHYEDLHKQIIDRFGRYPHRNQVLGRTSSKEEEEFLNQPNSSF